MRKEKSVEAWKWIQRNDSERKVVKLYASTRRLLKERPNGFKRRASAAGFILLTGNAGGFFRESSGLAGVTPSDYLHKQA